MLRGYSLIEETCSFKDSKPVKKEKFSLGTEVVCVGLFLEEKGDKEEFSFFKNYGGGASVYAHFKGASKLIIEGNGVYLALKVSEGERKFSIAVCKEKEYPLLISEFFFGELPQPTPLQEIREFTKLHRKKNPLPFFVLSGIVLLGGGFFAYQKVKEFLSKKEEVKPKKVSAPPSFTKREAVLVEEYLTGELLKTLARETQKHYGVYSRIEGFRVYSKLSPSLVGYKVDFSLEYLYPVVPSNFKVCKDLPCWATKKVEFVKRKNTFKKSYAFREILERQSLPSLLNCAKELARFGFFPKKVGFDEVYFPVKGSPVVLLKELWSAYKNGCRYYVKSLSCFSQNCSGVIIVRNDEKQRK